MPTPTFELSEGMDPAGTVLLVADRSIRSNTDLEVATVDWICIAARFSSLSTKEVILVIASQDCRRCATGMVVSPAISICSHIISCNCCLGDIPVAGMLLFGGLGTEVRIDTTVCEFNSLKSCCLLFIIRVQVALSELRVCSSLSSSVLDRFGILANLKRGSD